MGKLISKITDRRLNIMHLINSMKYVGVTIVPLKEYSFKKKRQEPLKKRQELQRPKPAIDYDPGKLLEYVLNNVKKKK